MRMTTNVIYGFAGLCLLGLLTACGVPSAPTLDPNATSIGGGVSVGVNNATPTPLPTSIPTNSPTATSAPSVTPAPTSAPRGTATSVKLATYTGSGAPFSVQYPENWTPNDLEKDQRLVVITSPDQESSLIVTYGAAGNLTAEQALDAFLKGFNLPNLKVSNQHKNTDGSMGADLTFDDPTSGSPLQGILRLVRQATSTQFYVIIFGSSPDQFAQSRTLGNSLLTSFQEKPSIVRQNTPPVVAPATSTATPIRPTATFTPIALPTATNTPLPPPTNTPVPAPPFRLDLNVHGGYEDWGWPKDGCNTFATGQFDNTHPAWKLSIDVTFYNDSTRAVRWAESTSFINEAGNEMLACYISDVADPPVPAKGQAKLTFFIFTDRNQYMAAMRIDVSSPPLRRCFARNKQAQVVTCN